MKRNLLPIFLLFTFKLSAFDPVFHPDSSKKKVITFQSDYFFASNAITNNFASSYFLKEFIDNDKKDDVTKKLSALNRLGAGFNTSLKYEIRYKTFFSLPDSYISFGISNRYHINSLFKKDVFELYFRGNKSYAGETADLGNFVYNHLVWQQVNFSFGHFFKRDKNRFEYSGGISFIKGQKLYNIDAPRALLFTEQSGSYLDLDATIKIRQSDSSNTSFNAWNGTGASLNGSFSWKAPNNSTFNFSIESLGIIAWNKNTAFISADTSYRFDGVDVSYLFNFSDSVEQTVSLDSSLVEPYLSSREKRTFTSPLPALAVISYKYILIPSQSDLEAGIQYLFCGHAALRGTLTFSYVLNRRHKLSLKTSYGGYTGFQAGLAYQAYIANSWMIQLQSDYLSSILDKRNGTAQGAFVSLSRYF